MFQRDDHDWRLTMLSAIREVQIPFLAAMLVGGCGAKAFRVLRAREMMAALGPTALMPLRLRRPIAIGLCAAEFAFGVALIVTAGLRIGLFAAELALFAALSPEIGEAMIRLGYSEPCEVRRISVERTLAALAGSTPWRRYAGMITSAAPADIWREGCWRYVLYTGQSGDRRVEIVFAVYLRVRHPQIRAAVLDAATDEVLTDLPGRPCEAAQPRHLRRLVTDPARFGDAPGPDVPRPPRVRPPASVTQPPDVSLPLPRAVRAPAWPPLRPAVTGWPGAPGTSVIF